MSRVVELLRSRRVPQFAVLALMSVGFAGCSADMQTRFRKTPFPIPLPLSRRPPARCRRRAPGRAPRAAAICAAASPPQSQSVAACCRRRSSGAAILSGAQQRRVGRRARAFVLYPAEPSASSRPPARVAPRSVAARARRMAAPRSSSAPAIRSTSWRSATMFRRPRSCRPMATRGRARCRPASS